MAAVSSDLSTPRPVIPKLQGITRIREETQSTSLFGRLLHVLSQSKEPVKELILIPAMSPVLRTWPDIGRDSVYTMIDKRNR